MMKKIIRIILFLIWSATIFLLGVKLGINGNEKRIEEDKQKEVQYTGQQIQDAVNNYRRSLDLKELKVDSNLCNNLFDRYAKMLSDQALIEGHPGFNEWADNKIKDYSYSLVGEVFSPELTVEKVLEGWKGSPSHNLAITSEKYNKVCTYAGEKGVVVVLGAK